jgi:hypothetical protein
MEVATVGSKFVTRNPIEIRAKLGDFEQSRLCRVQIPRHVGTAPGPEFGTRAGSARCLRGFRTST